MVFPFCGPTAIVAEWAWQEASSPARTQHMPPQRTAPAAVVRPWVEELESRETPAVTIRFDFTYDRTGFFNDPARRAALQQAAGTIGPRLNDTLAGLAPSGNNSWQASFFNPGTNSTVVLTNPTIQENEIVVFVAAAPIGDGELGLTTTGGYSASGTRTWLDKVRNRGQAGASATPKTDFSTWGGMITFDSQANWNFTTNPPDRAQYDFNSVTLHELMHVFGFGLGEPAFTRNITGWNGSTGKYTGAAVTAIAGGSLTITGDSGVADHWAPGTSIDGLESPLQPALVQGVKRGLTRLEYAVLQDLGWEVFSGPVRTSSALASGPVLSSTATAADIGTANAIASTIPAGRFSVGTSAGVVTYGSVGEILTTSRPVDPGTNSATRVATADVTGDGIPDLISASGPGRAVQISVVDGATNAELVVIQPFEASFTGGAFVASADLNGDGMAELVVTADQGGGPVVVVYDGAALANRQVKQLNRFMGINDPAFRGGARATFGDVNRDGTPDLIIAAGFGGGPRIAVYDGKTVRGGRPVALMPDFFAFEPGLRNGAYVTAVDLDGDGFAEVIAGAGPGGAPRVAAFSGKQLLANKRTTVANFFTGTPDARGGVRVATADVDSDGRPDLITGSGTGGQVAVYAPRDVLRNTTSPAAWLTVTLPDASVDGVYVG